MNGQHAARRVVRGAFVVGLAFLAATGAGQGVDAKGVKVGDLPDKGYFSGSCKSVDGVWVDSPKDNVTACFYTDGSKLVCDQQAKNCYSYPPPPKKHEPGGSHLADVTQVIAGGGTLEAATAPGGQAATLDAAPDGHGKGDAKHGKGGKKRGNGGKRGKK